MILEYIARGRRRSFGDEGGNGPPSEIPKVLKQAREGSYGEEEATGSNI